MPPASQNLGPMKLKETETGEFESSAVLAAAIPRTFGTDDGHLITHLFLQVLRALPRTEEKDPDGNHALAALYGFGPRDTIEGMIACQAVTVHNHAMECFMRAACNGQCIENMALYLKLAAMLQKTFIGLIDGFQQRRSQSLQKTHIQPVTIYDEPEQFVGPTNH